MRYLAQFVAIFVVIVGITGLAAPDTLLAMGQYVATPAGLYAIAAIRVVIAIVLILAASRSRAPRLLRAFGVVVLVAGLLTPLFGVERTRAVLEWESTQGTALIRAGAVLALALGGLLAFAVAPVRRAV